MNEITISPWDSYTLGTVPAIYDKGLSYLQQVAYLRYHVKKLDERVQDSEKAINSINYELTLIKKDIREIEKRAEEFENRIKNNENDISSMKEEIEYILEWKGEILKKITGINESISQIENEIETIVALFNAEFSTVHIRISKIHMDVLNYMRRFKDEMEEYIKGQCAERTGELILVQNPASNMVTSLNKALEDIYSLLYTFGGITRREYSRLNLTMEAYREYKITRKAYATRAIIIFLPLTIRKTYMKDFETLKRTLIKRIEDAERQFYDDTHIISPYDGKRVNLADLAIKNANQHCGSMTIGEYESLRITKEEYSEYKMTLEEYFRKSLCKYVISTITEEKIERWNSEEISGSVYIWMTFDTDGKEQLKFTIETPPGIEALMIGNQTMGMFAAVNGKIEKEGKQTEIGIQLYRMKETNEKSSITINIMLRRMK